MTSFLAVLITLWQMPHSEQNSNNSYAPVHSEGLNNAFLLSFSLTSPTPPSITVPESHQLNVLMVGNVCDVLLAQKYFLRKSQRDF